MKQYTEKFYYIQLPEPMGMFGVIHTRKEMAIKTFLDNLKTEESIDSEYWINHSKEYRKLLDEGKIEIVTITKQITEEVTKEILKFEH